MSQQRYFTRIHLVNGQTITGIPTPLEEGWTFEEAQEVIGEVLKGSSGWQINTVTEDGWAVAPYRSVLYVEILREES